MKSEKEIKIISSLVLVVFIFCFFISLWQVVFGIESINFFFGEYNPNTGIDSFLKRIPSIFDDAQAAGQFFASISIFSFGLAFSYFKKNKLIIIIPIFGVLALFLTITRISMFGFFSALLVTQILRLSIKKSIFYLIIILSLILFSGNLYENIVPPQIKARLNWYAQAESFKWRYRIWEDSLAIIKQYPLGVGLGGENLYVAGLKQRVTFAWDYVEDPKSRKYTHFENSYLDLLYSLGILGFSGFILLIILFFFSGFTILSKVKYLHTKRFTRYLMGAMIAWLISASTSPQMKEIQPMMIFMIFLALMNSLKNIYLKDLTRKL